ncbi:MAG: thioredoxin reductase, partial [Acidimicrobiia bacterium]|nr:thioredoxin reductase [Acidimicrobiia bacterium]
MLATGARSVHQALPFRQLSDEVIYFSHAAPPDPQQVEQLAARRIRVIDDQVTALELAGGRLTGVRLANGNVVDRDVVAVMPGMVARASFLADLGLRPAEHPSGLGEHVP